MSSVSGIGRAEVIRLMLVVATVLLTCAGTGAQAVPVVSSSELVERPTVWDGKSVVFEGEAIGEAMVRRESVWLHLNDDGYATRPLEAGGPFAGYNSGMPVLVDRALVSAVEHYGDYDTRGDLVRITGVFHAASPEHGGDLLIEATQLEVVRKGGEIPHPIEGWKLALIAGLAVAFAGVEVVRRRQLRAY